MGKSKAVKNAFYYFMVDVKNNNPAKYPSLASVSADAGELWQKMNAEERRPYEQKAKKVKGKSAEIKLTSQGVPINFVERRANALITKEQRMKDDIKGTVQLIKSTNTADSHMFYLIHVNFFLFRENERKYYPAEIAICRFNLKNGVLVQENVYTSLMNPGPLPMGFHYAAKTTSEESHQIPIPKGDDMNLFEVWDNMLIFMKQLEPEKLPPVYASSVNYAIVENVLQELALQSGYKEDYIKVYKMDYLLYCLKNINEPVWHTLSSSAMVLEKDPYDFTRNISCEFHESSEVTNFCSKSFVIRSAYIFCENLCEYFCIALIPGQHIPYNAKISYTIDDQQRSKRNTSKSLNDDEDSRSETACSLASGLSYAGETSKPYEMDYLSERTDSVLSFNTTQSSCYQSALTTQQESEASQDSDWNEVKGRNKKTTANSLRRPTTSSQIDADFCFTPRGRGRGYSNK